MRVRLPGLLGAITLCLLLLTAAGCTRAQNPERESVDLDSVGDFALTERTGTTVRKADLLGKVWVASFVFTRCTGPCPQVTATMTRLQSDLPADADAIRLVTFTVDPTHDRPAELNRYAEAFGADPKRWLFLTGSEAEIYQLLIEGFHVPVEKTTGDDHRPGNEVMHSPRLVVVDKQGHVRGYFNGVVADDDDRDLANKEFEQNYQRLRVKVVTLARDKPAFGLPELNATLNGIALVLLVIGYTAIRRGNQRLHITCMVSALVVSSVFLGSYLYYHYTVGHVSFAEQFQERHGASPVVGLARTYVVILVTHVILAAVIAPLAVVTAYLGWSNRLAWHKRIAYWTLPIWLYVSITGVVVYWMVYRL